MESALHHNFKSHMGAKFVQLRLAAYRSGVERQQQPSTGWSLNFQPHELQADSQCSQARILACLISTASVGVEILCSHIMPTTKLENLPPEVLTAVCTSFRDDRAGLLSISQVSKYLRAISVPIIFKHITITTSTGRRRRRRSSRPPTRDTRASLLRTIVANPSIAAHVSNVYCPSSRGAVPSIDEEDMDFILQTASKFDVPVPELLRFGGADPALEGRRGWALSDDDMQRLVAVRAFFAELIIAHTPNIVTLDYSIGRYRNALEVLGMVQASSSFNRQPMFPVLKNVRLQLFGPGIFLRTLPVIAPNLQTLRIQGLAAPMEAWHFDRVKDLRLTSSNFTGPELRTVLTGCPALTNFDYDYYSLRDQRCAPQDVLDALGGFETQLEGLSLNFHSDTWTGRGREPLPTDSNEPNSGLIVSLKHFTALVNIQLDSVCLWKDTGKESTGEDQESETEQILINLLPRAVKNLRLT
ncbi:hypothetical protein BDP55DRAFT_630936 [Colletotrichum godetiae]|uniref:F-box domain-containing protein n=1 Tax=Colletotrichum godetiae TaxID=1209918 RepID=A0AAJ0AMZ2_9PEZI|nr:uncharacterized protein BDP55DRAFT_630936 [Colletotrichum godetiae]KAK1676849.1 hypothetical protein BDP55DRAFT_630936 [Colletotrichum godetiae]